MGAESTIPLMLALTLCIALLGPGLVSVEDTRKPRPPQPRPPGDILEND